MSIDKGELSDWYLWNIAIYDEMTTFVNQCKKLKSFDRMSFSIKLLPPEYYAKDNRYYTYLGRTPIDPDKRHTLPNFPKEYEILRIKVVTSYRKFQNAIDNFFNNVQVTPGGKGDLRTAWSLGNITERVKRGLYKKPEFDVLYNLYLTFGMQAVYNKYNKKLYKSKSQIIIPIVKPIVAPKNRKFSSDMYNMPSKESKTIMKNGSIKNGSIKKEGSGRIREFRIQHNSNIKYNRSQGINMHIDTKNPTMAETNPDSPPQGRKNIIEKEINEDKKVDDVLLPEVSTKLPNNTSSLDNKEKSSIVNSLDELSRKDVYLTPNKVNKISNFSAADIDKIMMKSIDDEYYNDPKHDKKLTELEFLNKLHYSIKSDIVEQRDYDGPENCIEISQYAKICTVPSNIDNDIDLFFSIITIDIERNTRILLETLSAL